MNGRIRRTAAVLICFLLPLVFAGSTAAEPDLNLLLTGETETPFSIRILSPEYQVLSQYGGERLEQFNRLMKHFSVDISMQQNLSETIVSIDDEAAVSVLSRETEDNCDSIYSVLPDTVFRQPVTEVTDDSFSFSGFLSTCFFRVNQEADGFYPFFETMSSSFAELTRENKTDLRLSGFGKGARRLTVSFPADYVQEHFPDILLSLTDNAGCKRLLSSLTFVGPQKVSLLYDQDDNLIRISYDGKTGASQETLRNVSLVWKCLRSETRKKDSFTLKTPAVSGYDRNNIIFERELNTSDPDRPFLFCDLQTDLKQDQDKVQIRLTADLPVNDGQISGKVVWTKKQNGETEKKTVVPNLTEESNGDYNGTIEITDYSGKIVKKKILARLHLTSADTLSFPEKKSACVPVSAHDTDSPAENELRQKLIQQIIRRTAALPSEDTVFLSSGIPESVWTALIH